MPVRTLPCWHRPCSPVAGPDGCHRSSDARARPGVHPDRSSAAGRSWPPAPRTRPVPRPRPRHWWLRWWPRPGGCGLGRPASPGDDGSHRHRHPIRFPPSVPARTRRPGSARHRRSGWARSILGTRPTRPELTGLRARTTARAIPPGPPPVARLLHLTSNSLPILLMRHARGRARRGRLRLGPPVVRGAPPAGRRARSIVAFCRPGPGPGLPRHRRRRRAHLPRRPRPEGPRRRSIPSPVRWAGRHGAGRPTRPRPPPANRRWWAPPAPGPRPRTALRAAGRPARGDPSAPGVMVTVSAASNRATRSARAVRDMPANHMVHEQDVTCCWREPSRRSTRAASSTSIPSGRRPLRRAGSPATSTSAVSGRASSRTTSRYSANDSQPVGSASPKLSWGRGENPSV